MDKIIVHYQKRKNDYKPYFLWLRKKNQTKITAICKIFLSLCIIFLVLILFSSVTSKPIPILNISISNTPSTRWECIIAIIFFLLSYLFIPSLWVSMDWEQALRCGFSIQSAVLEQDQITLFVLLQGTPKQRTFPYSQFNPVVFTKDGIYMTFNTNPSQVNISQKSAPYWTLYIPKKYLTKEEWNIAYQWMIN